MERNSNLEHLWDFAMPKKKTGLMRKTDPKPMSKQQAIAQDNRDKGKTSLRKANEVPGAANKKSVNRMQTGGRVIKAQPGTQLRNSPEQIEGQISRHYEQFKPEMFASSAIRGDARDRYLSQVTDSSTFKGRMGDINKWRRQDPSTYPKLIDSLYHSPDAATWKASANLKDQAAAVGDAQFKDWQAIRATRRPGYVMSNQAYSDYEKRQAGTDNPSNEFRGIRQALYQPEVQHTSGVKTKDYGPVKGQIVGALDMKMQYDPNKSPMYTAQTRRRRTVDGLLRPTSNAGFTPYNNGQKIN